MLSASVDMMRWHENSQLKTQGKFHLNDGKKKILLKVFLSSVNELQQHKIHISCIFNDKNVIIRLENFHSFFTTSSCFFCGKFIHCLAKISQLKSSARYKFFHSFHSWIMKIGAHKIMTNKSHHFGSRRRHCGNFFIFSGVRRLNSAEKWGDCSRLLFERDNIKWTLNTA